MTSLPQTILRWLQQFTIDSPVLFGVIAASLIGYILFMMFRKRRGERLGHEERELL
jgi:hypothetical protein